MYTFALAFTKKLPDRQIHSESIGSGRDQIVLCVVQSSYGIEAWHPEICNLCDLSHYSRVMISCLEDRVIRIVYNRSLQILWALSAFRRKINVRKLDASCMSLANSSSACAVPGSLQLRSFISMVVCLISGRCATPDHCTVPARFTPTTTRFLGLCW